VCYIDQRDIMYNKYYYTGTYRIYFRYSRILRRGEGWLRPGGCRSVGWSGDAGERQTVIIFRRERARTHAHTHPHPTTQHTDYVHVYGGEINLFYILLLLLLLLFPSRVVGQTLSSR